MASSRRRDPHKATAPERLADALSRYLRTTGITERVRQMSVLEQWEELVGPEIGSVTRALSITADGTLFAAAKSNAWMTELTLMEGELLASLNRVTGDRPIRRIRWSLAR
ncbi:MAG: DciA family protein [Gemmatimonadota bacterium]